MEMSLPNSMPYFLKKSERVAENQCDEAWPVNAFDHFVISTLKLFCLKIPIISLYLAAKVEVSQTLNFTTSAAGKQRIGHWTSSNGIEICPSLGLGGVSTLNSSSL